MLSQWGRGTRRPWGPRKRRRQESILSELRARPSTRLGEFANQFGVSKETIRRDIAELSERGLVARTYGGALPAHLDFEPARERARARLNPEGRRRMAEIAAGLVADCRVVMIDAGSTMTHVCEGLAANVPRDGGIALTVLTNGVRNMLALAQNPAIRVICCPGTYAEAESGIFGALTVEFIAGFNAEAFLMSASGIGPERVTDANSDAAAVKRAMLRRSGRAILVADAQKHNHVQFETVCALGELGDLVTDTPPPQDLAAALRLNNVRLHLSP
jgi:DeoR family glycerol-3-phosphate regulon repressor